MADGYVLHFFLPDRFPDFCSDVFSISPYSEDFRFLLKLIYWLPPPPIYLLFWGALVAFVSLSVRRLHDVGCSGFCFLVTFIPILNVFAWFIIAALDSVRGKNRYGDSEKYPDEVIPKKADMTPTAKTLETIASMNTVKAKFCPHCGNKIPGQFVFCSHCGGMQPNT